jgi:hypothetical protein
VYREWNATLFCEALGKRTILMMGDSSMQQSSSTLFSMVSLYVYLSTFICMYVDINEDACV